MMKCPDGFLEVTNAPSSRPAPCLLPGIFPTSVNGPCQHNASRPGRGSPAADVGPAAAPGRLAGDVMAIAPSASYSLTLRLEIKNRPAMLARVASAIDE